MRKIIFIVLLFSTLYLTACGDNQSNDAISTNSDMEKTVLTMGTKMPENNIESEGVKEFVKLVDEKTDGQIEIDVYYHEQLGDAPEQIENVINGAQDIYFESMTYYIPYVTNFNIHSLPFLFEDNDEYKEFLQTEMQENLEQELLEATGIRFINTDKNFMRGPYRVLVSTSPVENLDDLNGLNIRLAESTTSIKAWSALGTNTSVIAWADSYLALSQGRVDAVTSPISLVENMQFHEVAEYITITNEYPQSLVFAMNDEKFQSLEPELQEALEDAANESGVIGTKAINEESNEIVSSLKDEGVEIHEVDLAPWQEKMLTVYDELVEEDFLDGDLLDKILEWRENN